MARVARKSAVVIVSLPLVFGVAACSSNSSSSSPSPTASPEHTSSVSPTATHSVSPTATQKPTSTATASPTTAKPKPTGSVQGLTLSVSSTVAKKGDRIDTNVSGPASLAGKQVVLVDMIAPDKYKIFSKLTLNTSGKASGYLVLGVTDAVQAFVPQQSVSGGTWDPGTAVLAESGVVTITVK